MKKENYKKTLPAKSSLLAVENTEIWLYNGNVAMIIWAKTQFAWNESGNVLEHQKDEKSRILQGMFTLLNINHMMDLPIVRQPGGSMDPFLLLLLLSHVSRVWLCATP